MRQTTSSACPPRQPAKKQKKGKKVVRDGARAVLMIHFVSRGAEEEGASWAHNLVEIWRGGSCSFVHLFHGLCGVHP